MPGDFAEDVERARPQPALRRSAALRAGNPGIRVGPGGVAADRRSAIQAARVQRSEGDVRGARTPNCRTTRASTSASATIYQKLAFVASGEARGAAAHRIGPGDRARARRPRSGHPTVPKCWPLRASNAKSRWIDEFRGCALHRRERAPARSVRPTCRRRSTRTFSRSRPISMPITRASTRWPCCRPRLRSASAAPDEWTPFFDSDAKAAAALEAQEAAGRTRLGHAGPRAASGRHAPQARRRPSGSVVQGDARRPAAADGGQQAAARGQRLPRGAERGRLVRARGRAAQPLDLRGPRPLRAQRLGRAESGRRGDRRVAGAAGAAGSGAALHRPHGGRARSRSPPRRASPARRRPRRSRAV